MSILPIIERELRLALRKQRPVRRRLRMAAACAGGTVLFLLMAQVTGNGQASRELHQIFCLVGLYTVLRAPQLAAGLFARERRDQTLGLLFISGLSASEVFLSKVLSAAAMAFIDLLAIFPMLALPFLMGGVSFDLFLATIFCLPTLLLFAISVSLFASVLTDDDGAAVLLAAWIALAICALPPMVSLANGYFSGSPASHWWLRLSPAYGAWLVLSRFGSGRAIEFWRSFAATVVWSGLCLTTAAALLTRLWRERQEVSVDRSRWRQLCDDLLQGTATRRQRLAAKWLGANPFAWLVSRQRKPATLAWAVVGGIVGVWLACWLVWPAQWLSVPNLFITATLLNLSLRWIIHYTAAAGLGNARADGSYELLLTTSLHPSEIISGQLEALRAHFQPISRFVFALELGMMVIGLLLRPWDGPSLFVYFAIWTALLFWEWRQSWNQRGTLLTMWAGLNSGRAAHAVWRTFGFNSWIWVWILFNLRHGLSGFPSFPAGSLMELILTSVGMFLLLAYMFRPPDTLDIIERRLVLEFREIVREPLPEPGDPRFKQWNVRERFPWGWQILQQQLHERVVRRQLDGA